MTDTINTRELIMNILLEMDREKTPCHLAVRDALDKYQFLPRQDRAFIKRVCEGTVEYGIQNDYIINQYSKIKINKCKPVIRAILRMSVYQIRFLTRTDSAVVNEAVETGGKEAFLQLKGLCQRRSAHDRAGERSSADAEGEQYYAVSFREILHAGISG